MILQNKLWTADRIIKNGGQANAICSLCRTTAETATHMMASCSYSLQVWNEFASMGIVPPIIAAEQLPTTQEVVDGHDRAGGSAKRINHCTGGHLHRLELMEGAMPSSLRQQSTDGASAHTGHPTRHPSMAHGAPKLGGVNPTVYPVVKMYIANCLSFLF